MATFDQREQRVNIQYNVVIQIGTDLRSPLQLPARAEYFTGREQELEKLLINLQPGQVVTLCGPGGIGKTALAAEVLWRLTDGQNPPDDFPDGVIFYSFYEQPRAEMALEHIALSFSEDLRPTPAAAAQRALAGRQALLVLDGAEVCDNLHDVLAVRGGCGVLITSRARSDAVSERQDIAPLRDEPAVKLLQLWGNKWAANESVVMEICNLIGGLPLAIRLVGRYLNQQEEEATEYLAWLKETPLTALAQGKRQQDSVPLLVERSLAQVSETARQILTAVGFLAPAPFSKEVIAKTLKLSETELKSALSELINYSLLRRMEDRYQVIHTLIYTYAQQRLPTSIDCLRQLGHYYAELTIECTRWDTEGYQQLIPEWRHVMYVLFGLTGVNAWPDVLALAWAIYGWASRWAHGMEVLAVAGNGLAAATALDRQWDIAAFSGHNGNALLALGHTKEAIASYERAVTLFRKIGDQRQEGLWVGNVGVAHYYLGQIATAIEHHAEALAIAREVRDSQREGVWLSCLSADYHAIGVYELAIKCNEESLEIARDTEDHRSELNILGNLGVIYGELGQEEKSVDYYRKALTISREIGDRHSESVWLGNLGSTYADKGQLGEAIQMFTDALNIARDSGNRRHEGLWLKNLGTAYYATGQSERASVHLKEAFIILEKLREDDAEDVRLLLEVIQERRIDNSDSLDR